MSDLVSAVKKLLNTVHVIIEACDIEYSCEGCCDGCDEEDDHCPLSACVCFEPDSSLLEDLISDAADCEQALFLHSVKDTGGHDVHPSTATH